MAKSRKDDPRAASAVDRQIGARIRARRLELDISQTALGDGIGVTFQQIQKYERGVNRVAVSTLLEICKVLDCRPDELLPPDDRSSVGKASDLNDADAAKLLSQFVRLNAEGRRVLTGIVRSLVADDKLRKKS